MRVPECGERRIEDGELFVTLHQQRPAHAIHIVARDEVDVSECAGKIRQPAGVHRKAGGTKDAAEDHQVLDQPHRGAVRRAIARSNSSLALAPRSASRSSLALSTTPSVSSTAAGSSVSRSSATRAATQSMVSETPGTL